MKEQRIPFNWPHMTGKELHYIAQAHSNGSLAGMVRSRNVAMLGWSLAPVRTRRC